MSAQDSGPTSRDEAAPHQPVSPPSSPGQDAETFEDAVDTSSIRPLTGRTSSLQPTPSSDQPSSDAEQDAEPSAGPESAELEDAVSAIDEGETPEEQEATQQPENAHAHEHEQTGLEEPLPRLSQASVASLDNVNLDDDAALQKEVPKHSPVKEAKTISLSSIANALPSMPWSPSQSETPSKHASASSAAAVLSPLAPTLITTSTTASVPAPAPAPVPAIAHQPTPSIGRKISSPFAWLSRGSSSKEKEKESVIPPAIKSPRRNTASSVATLTSNPEMMLSRLEEEKNGDVNGTARGSRNSLKDRFKLLRMKEEAGVTLPTGDEPGAGDEKESKTLNFPPPPSPNPSIRSNLGPGTASGAHAGPSAFVDAPVDWDLWQSVVYEGPVAVARSSAEELNKAIATGIPHAIRGVIWQVLAQSKSEELEAVYRDLVVRGTDKAKDRLSNGTSASAASIGHSALKDQPKSSASSLHSDQSGGQATNGAPSPTEKDSENMARQQAAAMVERNKKAKEDQATLQKLEKTIRRDLGARTSYSKYAAAQGLQDGLFGVCKAYALFDEGVGYAQGMNFLIMPLLFNMTEEEAFCLLVRLMNHYHLRDLFIQDMPGLHLRLYQFERLLEDLEPALYCHLHRRSISPHLYATQWFLTLFAYRFPLQLVLRIYDLIFSEGLSAILKFGIVLMQKNAATLLGMTDMLLLTNFLKDRVFDVYIDAAPSSNSILENGFFGSSSSSIDKEVYRADQLVRDACEVKITPEMLRAYTTEWEEKTAAERAREAELDGLRSSNASSAIKVRRLEERIEAVDREQAALATDLVRTKVENEEVKDENESLRGQVKELRVVIEKQPLEIEEAWKLERDDLMKRNGRVHEENQRLEKELLELEEQLVQTKMRYAEINSQHETLNRKWTDLRRQFV